MTSRERVLAAAHCCQPDRVPCDMGFGLTYPVLMKFRQLTGFEWPEEYFKTDIRNIGFRESRCVRDYTSYFEGRVPKERTVIDEWGIAHVKSNKTDLPFDHIVSPLAGEDTPLEDIVDYALPDLDASYRYEHLHQDIQAVHQRGLAAMAPLATSLFEIAWQLRGIEDFMTDMLLEPEKCCCLLDKILALRLKQIEYYALAGADVIMLGDDIADQRSLMMALPLWREILKPRLAEMVAQAKFFNKDCVVFYHSDGNMMECIPDLIDIGVNIINPVQPECMDPEEVKRKYGDRICLWGTIGVQSTLPFGTPKEVEDTVKLRIETCGKGGGLILSPAHMIEPEVPWENVVALYEAIDRYGNY